jgi:Zn-dependent protease
MTSFLECPGSSRGEWRFHIFDVPVRVHPWFWLTVLFMGASEDVGSTLIWAAVCFISILVHELGHVAAFRFFGVRSDAVLYGFGGLAIPESDVRGTFARIAVSAAGPVAGFCLAAVAVACALASGAQLHPGFSTIVIPSLTAWVPRGGLYGNILMSDLLYVNICWGLMNLLPVYPLDGGQVARAFLEHRDPVRGKRRSLVISASVAAGVAVLGLATRSMYLVALFGALAAGSAQLLEADRPFFRPRPYDSSRR